MYMSNPVIQMQSEQNISFRNTLDNLLSTRKELSKINYILEQKEKECALLINKLKQKEIDIDTNEKKIKELEKQISLNKEQNNLTEDKLKKEIIFLKEQNENIKKEYEMRFNNLKIELEKNYKILKNNEINNNINRNSNSLFDIEKNSLKEKNLDLEKKNISLEQQIKLLQKENDNLNKENLDLKNDAMKNIEFQKLTFNKEKENTNIKKNSEMNNKYIDGLKLELNIAKAEIQKLNNILNGYKSQNNQLIIEFNQRKKEKNNEIDSLKFTVDLQKKQIIEISSNLQIKEKKLIEIQSELDVISNTYKNLEKNNQILIKEKDDYTKDFIEIQNELNMLRTILNEKENINDSIKAGGLRPENENEKINEELIQLGKYINIRNNECDELNKKLNSALEEKNILVNNLKDMKLELDNYKLLASTNKKDELYKKYQKMKKENEINLSKKKYYKEQCKLCNQIIDVIKNKLTKEQNIAIENDKAFQKLINIKQGNKYDNNYSFNNNNTNSKINISKNNNNINNNIEIKTNNNFENSYKKIINKDNTIDFKNNNNIYENEENNINNDNNNIILNDKFNNNIINDINDLDNNNNKNDKEKNNNEDDISEHISYYESINK